jgi:hypothetical protein
VLRPEKGLVRCVLGSPGMRVAYLILVVCLGALSMPALAQGQVTATILQSQRTGVAEGLGAAFDRTLRSRLDALHVVDTAGAVALDLEQIQLALGCMGETTECLAAVAAETQATIVVVPSLAQAGATTQATVLVFDTRDSSMRRATREAVGAAAEAELLGGTEGLLRELFGLPAAVASEGPDVTPPTTHPPVAALSPVPFVFIGVGAAALIGGIIAGVLSSSDGDAYARAPIGTNAQADAALSILDRAQTEALAANILYIAGGALVAAGIVWELAAGREDGSSPLSLAPSVGPGSVGLALSGSFGGDL